MKRSPRTGSICAVAGHVTCELGGETVIMQVNSGKYYTLNYVGAYIWQMIQQPCTFDMIVSSVVQEYGAERQEVEVDVDELLMSMLAEGVIQVSGGNAL